MKRIAVFIVCFFSGKNNDLVVKIPVIAYTQPAASRQRDSRRWVGRVGCGERSEPHRSASKEPSSEVLRRLNLVRPD